MHKPTLSRLLLVLFLLSGLARAQEEDTERWFKVELMIFSHEVANNSTEQWEATPALAYPGQARFLVEPERVEANLAAHRAESVVDDFGRQILTLLPEPVEISDGIVSAMEAQQPEEIAVREPVQDPNEAEMPELQEIPTTPTPFVTLPASDKTFYGKAAYMQRSGRYRTLFHQAWYQPVISERDALPIVIDRSGDSGDWPRLQGSVKLYLSRYLHAETNLWLNTDGHYLPGEWRMPPPPMGPPSLIIEELPPPELAIGEEVPPMETAKGPAAVEDGWTTESAIEGELDAFGVPLEGEVLDPNEIIGEPEPVYPWRHAVLLRQKRRMRSTEVHYIDHPLLGVVVTFTPISDEELEALALAEAGLAPEAGSPHSPQTD